MLKEFIRKVFYQVISIINCVMPKADKIFVYGDSILKGNSEAMVYFLSKRNVYNVICMTDYHRSYEGDKIKFIRCSNIRALLYMVTCKIVLDSSLHSIKVKPTKNQMIIQMWHGSPIKYLRPTKYTNEGEYYTHFFYAAEIFKQHLADAFKTSQKKMYLNGSPCNDYFYRNDARTTLAKTKKNIIWLPTYRQWSNLLNMTTVFPILDENNINGLNDLLVEYDMTIFIKHHGNQTEFLDFLVNKKYSNIQIIDDLKLMHCGTTLYEFLSNSDALITDYSSVSFDYLLLNRPIGYTVSDIEEYSEKVGFGFTNPLEYMPGAKINTMDELMLFLTNIHYGVDEYESERYRVNREVNFYQDGKCADRCMLLVDSLINVS